MKPKQADQPDNLNWYCKDLVVCKVAFANIRIARKDEQINKLTRFFRTTLWTAGDYLRWVIEISLQSTE